MFDRRGDYLAFLNVLAEACLRIPVSILAYCLMPDHWHLLLWLEYGRGEDLSAFMHWLTLTHAVRWHAHRGTTGLGHVYQGRFRSFPVQEGGHTLNVCRYVEQNPRRSGLAEELSDWEWSSLWARTHGSEDRRKILSDLPRELSRSWRQLREKPLSGSELRAIRECVRRGRPYGDEAWTAEVAEELGLQSTLRPIGRPRKSTGADALVTRDW
ncbi:MAG: transposase [Planctomycetota bacterium]|jgi:putative transposase